MIVEGKEKEAVARLGNKTSIIHHLHDNQYKETRHELVQKSKYI